MRALFLHERYVRRRRDGDLSHTQITAVIFAPKIAPKGIKLPPNCPQNVLQNGALCATPQNTKNLVTVEITRFFAFLLGAPAGISPAGDKLRLPGRDQKKISPPKRRGDFFGAPAGISPNGDKLRLPGSSQKKYSPAKRRGNIFWCSSGDSNPGHPA